MFDLKPADPALSPIRYVAESGPAVAYPPTTAAYRTVAGHLLTIAGVALPSAVTGFGSGARSAAATVAPAAVTGVDPVRGESHPKAGDQQPLGAAVTRKAKARSTDPTVVRVRFAPGTLQPPALDAAR